MKRYGKRLFVRWSTLLLSIAATATLTLNASGTELEQRTKLLEDQTKMLMTSEAQQGFKERFKVSFSPDKTELLLGADLERWVQAHRPQVPLPEPVKTAIRTKQGAGLLIQQGLPGNKGGQQNVMYLRAPLFGGLRLFLNEEPDPCGDGNPAMCEFCSGGCGTGCYCTMGCGSCQVCPKC